MKLHTLHEPTQNITRHDFIDPESESQRILVVVFLRGGADGLTLVPPTGDDVYMKARPFLGIRAKDAIDLDGYFSLNTTLKPLMPFYEQGDMAIVHGAGSEDETRSHFEAQDFMEHAGKSGDTLLLLTVQARQSRRTTILLVQHPLFRNPVTESSSHRINDIQRKRPITPGLCATLRPGVRELDNHE